MNANHLFNWLQRDRDGTLDRRALYGEAGGPLAFVEAGGPLAFVEAGVIGSEASGRGAPALEIELACGARVKVAAGMDPGLLGPLLLAVRAAS
jgi:hypothetical protein